MGLRADTWIWYDSVMSSEDLFNSNSEIVIACIKAGADVNATSGWGFRSPLMHAAEKNAKEICTLLALTPQKHESECRCGASYRALKKMEPGRIELPCRNSQQYTSTQVVRCSISVLCHYT